MKKPICIFTIFLLFLPSLFAQGQTPETKSAIGFFSGYNKDGTITIMASYKAWKCEVVEKKQVEGIIPGDLVEFEFYMKGELVMIVKLINHKVPSQKELEQLLNKYKK